MGTRGGHYIFISTVSVYKDNIPFDSDEHAELVSLEPLENVDVAAVSITKTTYGPLKVLCERRAIELYPTSLIIRPTYVFGPYDFTMRFPKWIQKVEKGGVVECPVSAIKLLLICNLK